LQDINLHPVFFNNFYIILKQKGVLSVGKIIIAAVVIALCLFAYTKLNSTPKRKNPEGDFAARFSKEIEL